MVLYSSLSLVVAEEQEVVRKAVKDTECFLVLLFPQSRVPVKANSCYVGM